MDLLALIQFTEKYAIELENYGVKDQRFHSGAAALSNTFVKKILKTSSEIVKTIIDRELADDPELSESDKFVTNSPTDIFKVI